MALKRQEAASPLSIILLLLPFVMSAVQETEKDKDLSDSTATNLQLSVVGSLCLVDLEKLKGIVNGAKGKFESADYFLDDSQPGHHFDGIATAGSYFARVANTVGNREGCTLSVKNRLKMKRLLRVC